MPQSQDVNGNTANFAMKATCCLQAHAAVPPHAAPGCHILTAARPLLSDRPCHAEYCGRAGAAAAGGCCSAVPDRPARNATGHATSCADTCWLHPAAPRHSTPWPAAQHTPRQPDDGHAAGPAQPLRRGQPPERAAQSVGAAGAASGYTTCCCGHTLPSSADAGNSGEHSLEVQIG